MFEDLEPRPARGAPLIALTREDLDGYSVEDLKQRIDGLQAEIDRSKAAIEGKSSQRNAALRLAWPLQSVEAPRHAVPVVIRMRLSHESG